MFDIKDKVEDIVDNVEDIAKTYYRLSVVKVADKGSKLGLPYDYLTAVFAFVFCAVLCLFWIKLVDWCKAG
ncbi:hypothetical protein LWM68_31900 [Niabella sp. W65]|nr:hypothetical protein [Niabella sp. W65]MCH7366966.1 hypothetical protein [Niabella sp. W65]ULT42655.1 hypothetical protein KRR40_03430 [Niabella sp. I65]